MIGKWGVVLMPRLEPHLGKIFISSRAQLNVFVCAMGQSLNTTRLVDYDGNCTQPLASPSFPLVRKLRFVI